MDIDFARLILGGRHRLQTAVIAHSGRTVAIDGQILFAAVLEVLKSGGSPLRYEFNVWQNSLARFFVDFTCVNSISPLLLFVLFR